MEYKLRIGIDASNIRAGGGLTHLIELLSCSNPLVHKFDTITIWASQSTIALLPTEPWIIKKGHFLLERSIIFRTIWQIFFLSSEAKKNCDILFLPAGNTTDFHPYVSMCQNLLPFESIEQSRYGFSRMKARLMLLRWRQCQSFRHSDGLIFLSKYSQKVVFNSCKGINNFKIIPHGVSDKFKSNVKRVKIRAKTIKLLYVSIIDVYKHQWQVIKALHKLLDLGFQLELTLAGSYYPAALKKVNKAIEERPEYQSNINLVGNIAYEKLPEIYQDSDLFIFASTCETFGMIVLEAMASGLPLLCSERSSMKEIVGDAALYFNPLDVNDIAGKMEECLSDPALIETLSQKSINQAAKFSWERCTGDTFSCLSKVAKHYSGDVAK